MSDPIINSPLTLLSLMEEDIKKIKDLWHDDFIEPEMALLYSAWTLLSEARKNAEKSSK